MPSSNLRWLSQQSVQGSGLFPAHNAFCFFSVHVHLKLGPATPLTNKNLFPIFRKLGIISFFQTFHFILQTSQIFHGMLGSLIHLRPFTQTSDLRTTLFNELVSFFWPSQFPSAKMFIMCLLSNILVENSFSLLLLGN